MLHLLKSDLLCGLDPRLALRSCHAPRPLSGDRGCDVGDICLGVRAVIDAVGPADEACAQDTCLEVNDTALALRAGFSVAAWFP